MFSVDLNFLSEDEVEAIVSVIEKDFELKAAEKARLCKLRKSLINIDQKASFITRIVGRDNACLVCGSRFIPIIYPRQTCSSCNISVCRNCCIFVKSFQKDICKICHKQKDLLAMNCTWFYDNMRRKYMDGGSQIVVNSLSEYPRKNVISLSILGMVKGAQITKFKHQIQITNNTILESLLKVESLSTLTAEMKSKKYTELLSKYKENLTQIIRNVSLVLFITLENYNNKKGARENTTDLEVLTTLHEEVELMVGKKINIRICKEQILYENKGLDDLDSDFSLEEILSSAILEKLCSDHLQYIMDVYKLPYDDIDPVLKSMVKKSKLDSMDFDFDSVSQVPSRHNTIRKSKYGPPISPRINHPLIEQEDGELDELDNNGVKSDDSRNSSVLYKMSGKHAKSLEISKKWNETKFQTPPKSISGSNLSKTPSQRTTSSRLPESMKLDSDTISMVSTETTAETKVSSSIKPEANWLLHARCPRNSLKSLTSPDQGQINGSNLTTKSQVRTNQDDLYAHLDEDIEHIYKNNSEIQQRSKPTFIDNRNSKLRLSNINREYRRNFIETVNPNPNAKSEESQDSGIVISQHNNQAKSPLSRSNSIRLSRNDGHRRSRSFNNPEKITKPITNKPEYDEPSVSEDSDIDINKNKI